MRPKEVSETKNGIIFSAGCEAELKRRKRLLMLQVLAAFLLLAIWPQFSPAQEKVLSRRADKLTRALAALQKAPDDPQVQETYLRAFPADYETFLELFDFGRELYDGHDFVVVLPALAKDHEREVGKLLVQLSKDAHYEADAPSSLQQATAAYGSQHTKAFAKLLKLLTTDRQHQLITFLADVESHPSYKEYQEIEDHLRALGEGSLADKFERARAKRRLQPDD